MELLLCVQCGMRYKVVSSNIVTISPYVKLPSISSLPHMYHWPPSPLSASEIYLKWTFFFYVHRTKLDPVQDLPEFKVLYHSLAIITEEFMSLPMYGHIRLI